MKKTLALFSLLFCFFAIQAQTNSSDSKLLVKYSQKELKALKKDKPQEYEFAKYCIDNAFYVGVSSKEKISTEPEKYGEVIIKDLANINFYELKIELKQSEYQAFVIKGTYKLLIVKSKDLIHQELKTK